MKKKCAKALRTRAIGYTNVLFESCVREVLGLINETQEELDMAMDFIRQAQTMAKLGPLGGSIYDDSEVEEMRIAQEKVSTLYQERMKQLPTKALNEILKAHELEGGIRRAPQTIETILSELARRTILDDSNESEFIDNNGDVDGPKTKSKRNSSKTLNKRRKTSKS